MSVLLFRWFNDLTRQQPRFINFQNLKIGHPFRLVVQQSLYVIKMCVVDKKKIKCYSAYIFLNTLFSIILYINVYHCVFHLIFYNS